MSSLLQVEYSCHGCGAGTPPEQRIKVTVRHRREGQDIVEWLNDCARLVAMDHGRRSPLCPSKVFDLMIPMPDDKKGIGFG